MAPFRSEDRERIISQYAGAAADLEEYQQLLALRRSRSPNDLPDAVLDARIQELYGVLFKSNLAESITDWIVARRNEIQSK